MNLEAYLQGLIDRDGVVLRATDVPFKVLHDAIDEVNRIIREMGVRRFGYIAAYDGVRQGTVSVTGKYSSANIWHLVHTMSQFGIAVQLPGFRSWIVPYTKSVRGAAEINEMVEVCRDRIRMDSVFDSNVSWTTPEATLFAQLVTENGSSMDIWTARSLRMRAQYEEWKTVRTLANCIYEQFTDACAQKWRERVTACLRTDALGNYNSPHYYCSDYGRLVYNNIVRARAGEAIPGSILKIGPSITTE